MERKFNDDDKVTLECTSNEVADLWYAVERALESMKGAGLQEDPIYARLKALEDTFKG